MLYGLFRIVLFFIIFLIIFILMRKSNTFRKKRNIIVSLILCIIVCAISFLIPIENLVIHFKSPQDVFHYIRIGEIEDTVDGNESSLIFSSDAFCVIPKTETGYKIPNIFSTNTIRDELNRNGNYKIIEVENTNDFYLWGATLCKGGKIDITDSSHSKLRTIITKNGNSDYYTVLIYGNINYSDGYYLIIDGEKIQL